MSYPHYDLVTRAHSELVAEGLIGPRTNQTDVENDKGLICRRAAYYVNVERDATHGLMEKTEGNNSLGYSVDWILRSVDGVGWDITSDDGVNAFPVNGSEHPPDPSYIPRWRQPTADLAQLSPAPVDPPPEEVTDDELFEILEMMQMQQAADTSAILARDDYNTQRILDTIDSIKTQVEESLQKALFLWLRRHEEDEDTGGVV